MYGTPEQTEVFSPNGNFYLWSSLCCMCGKTILPNPANKCEDCIRQQVDITEGITREASLTACRTCGKYLHPPKTWIHCEPESRELLTICLKTIKGLQKLNLVDARFVWTEPHSRRIIVRVTIRKEVFGAVLQQDLDITFTVKTLQCPDCTREGVNETWQTVVQIRQKVDHKRTFIFLEQQILKHKAQKHAISIQQFPDGLDFYFWKRARALHFTRFIQDFTPSRMKETLQILHDDIRNHTQHKRYTINIEIAPICREDLCILPQPVAQKCSGIGRFIIVTKVTKQLHFVDPKRMLVSECSAQLFFQYPFTALCSASQLSEFTVVDSTLTGKTAGKFAQCELTLLPTSSSSSTTDSTLVYALSHLGNILHPGDLCLAYDLRRINLSAAAVDDKLKASLPDIVVVRKTHAQTHKRLLLRNTLILHHITVEQNQEDEDEEAEKERRRRGDKSKKSKKGSAMIPIAGRAAKLEEEVFLRELEDDPELRAGVSLYRFRKVEGKEGKEGEDEDEDDDDLIGDSEILDEGAESSDDSSEDEEEEEEEEEGEGEKESTDAVAKKDTTDAAQQTDTKSTHPTSSTAPSSKPTSSLRHTQRTLEEESEDEDEEEESSSDWEVQRRGSKRKTQRRRRH